MNKTIRENVSSIDINKLVSDFVNMKEITRTMRLY